LTSRRGIRYKEHDASWKLIIRHSFNPFTLECGPHPIPPFLPARHRRGRVVFNGCLRARCSEPGGNARNTKSRFKSGGIHQFAMKHKIQYEAIVDVVYFGYDYPPCVEMTALIWPLIERQTKNVSADARRVLLHMLAIHEHRSGVHPNPCAWPVDVHQGVLPRITNLTTEQLHDALVDLRVWGLIEGENPKWGIVDGRSYYSPPRKPGARRKQLSDAIRKIVLAAGRCLKCGRTDRLSVDHITPVARGGGDELTNLQCLCLYCNCAKRDRYIG
jgi:hypothetical protein